MTNYFQVWKNNFLFALMKDAFPLVDLQIGSNAGYINIYYINEVFSASFFLI